MRLRVLAALVLGGCSFSVGITGGDARDASGDAIDGPTDGSTIDANPCHAVEVSAQSAHTCARMETGDVWCWGINDRGEIGRPVQSSNCHSGVACNATPEKLVMPPATRLGVSEEHACAIAGSQVYCWGRNAENQFGSGTAADAPAPVMIAERAGASAIGGGLSYGCSLHGAAVKCAGANTSGEVGDTTGMARSMPVTTVPSGTQGIATGYHHACAIESGFVYCWGSNSGGEVDTHQGADVLSPRIVANIGTAVAVAAGFSHTCAVLAAGDMRCWGDNDSGQLGVGDALAHHDQVNVPILTGIVEVAASVNHTCARTPAGTVYCWGDGYTPTPTEVPLPHPAVSIASGSYHDCFALTDGAVWCLGWNAYGQLGLGSAGNVISDTVSQVQLCP